MMNMHTKIPLNNSDDSFEDEAFQVEVPPPKKDILNRRQALLWMLLLLLTFGGIVYILFSKPPFADDLSPAVNSTESDVAVLNTTQNNNSNNITKDESHYPIFVRKIFIHIQPLQVRGRQLLADILSKATEFFTKHLPFFPYLLRPHIRLHLNESEYNSSELLNETNNVNNEIANETQSADPYELKHYHIRKIRSVQEVNDNSNDLKELLKRQMKMKMNSINKKARKKRVSKSYDYRHGDYEDIPHTEEHHHTHIHHYHGGNSHQYANMDHNILPPCVYQSKCRLEKDQNGITKIIPIHFDSNQDPYLWKQYQSYLASHPTNVATDNPVVPQATTNTNDNKNPFVLYHPNAPAPVEANQDKRDDAQQDPEKLSHVKWIKGNTFRDIHHFMHWHKKHGDKGSSIHIYSKGSPHDPPTVAIYRNPKGSSKELKMDIVGIAFDPRTLHPGNNISSGKQGEVILNSPNQALAKLNVQDGAVIGQQQQLNAANGLMWPGITPQVPPGIQNNAVGTTANGANNGESNAAKTKGGKSSASKTGTSEEENESKSGSMSSMVGPLSAITIGLLVIIIVICILFIGREIYINCFGKKRKKRDKRGDSDKNNNSVYVGDAEDNNYDDDDESVDSIGQRLADIGRSLKSIPNGRNMSVD